MNNRMLIKFRETGTPNEAIFQVTGDDKWMKEFAPVLSYATGLFAASLKADPQHLADIANELDKAQRLMAEGKEFKGEIVETAITPDEKM